MIEMYLEKTRYEVLINVVGIKVEYIVNAVKVNIFGTLLERMSECCLAGIFATHFIQSIDSF